MICVRCDELIAPGDPYLTLDKLSPSAGGATLFQHKQQCPRPYTQTTQASVRH